LITKIKINKKLHGINIDFSSKYCSRSHMLYSELYIVSLRLGSREREGKGRGRVSGKDWAGGEEDMSLSHQTTD